ncbi:PREDICTED: EF-hand domain-containing family member B-like [Nicrophorus vespilloides]|uniref:EF-hand domain-containing family member B-like n=1 Tax=Nicrophorus vespilloides TaxID=110193 RepID=A0ABM1NEW2_NICVS|nr:PREDICTED: EF-hand domain-containing family member B-like [Nicrophorus vespilloides]
MAYLGKFKDRTPIICPAGVPCKVDGSMRECLRNYPTDDAIVAVLNQAGLKRVEPEPRHQRMENVRHRGAYQLTRPILNPPDETRYQTLVRDLRETVLADYWNKELGRGRDPTGGLPKGMDPGNTTFGDKILHDVTMKELINPPKSTYEIQFETNEFHNMYKKSHNDYYPGEKINRNYVKESYDPTRRYGMKTRFDPRGIYAKCALTSLNSEPIVAVNRVHADTVERTKFQLGKCLMPIGNSKVVPQNFTYGKKYNLPFHCVEELMKPDLEPSLLKRDLRKWMHHLNRVRCFLRKHPTDLKDIIELCRSFDEEQNGWLDFALVYDILKRNQIVVEASLLLPLLELFGLHKEGMVEFTALINFLDPQEELPNFGTFDDGVSVNSHYLTTNQAAVLDCWKMDNTNERIAGVPSRRLDMDVVALHPSQSRFEECNLSYESNAETLLNPSIFSNYQLTHRDFFLPREPQYLQKLFEIAGYQFPNDTFQKLWDLGVVHDKTGKVCIDTFRNLLKRTAPIDIVDRPLGE